MLDRVREFLATSAWIGHLPKAPGTYASVAAVATFVIARSPVGAWGWVALAGIVALSAFSVPYCAKSVFCTCDPSEVVIDEFAGMWLAMMVGGTGNLFLLALGFALFRALDILKPWPIRRIERIDGWVGVVGDDLAAGLVAGALARLAYMFVAG